MYIGIGPEYGKRIREEDAFTYACQRIFSEPQEERETAMQIFRDAWSFEEAEDALIEWYYSGNWIHEGPLEEKEISPSQDLGNLERVWWIRYSDGVTACCARSYRDAVDTAEAWVTGTELTYVIF